MSNQTLISIPIDLSNPKTLRLFLTNLVIKLDQVLGFRGDEKYATELELQGFATTALVGQVSSTLTQAINAVAADVQAIQDANYTSNPAQVDLANLTYTAPTMSATYTQAELQAVADNLELVANKINDTLSALRASNILE